MIESAQFLGQFGGHCLLFVKLCLLFEFLTFGACCLDAGLGILHRQIYVCFGFALGEIDVQGGRVSIQQSLIFTALFAGRFIELFLAQGFSGEFSLLVRRQRGTNFLGGVAGTVDDAVSAASTLLGQRIAADTAAADRVRTAIKLTGGLGRAGSEQNQKRNQGLFRH